MRIVKLTPKFKAYHNGFTRGLRFDNYDYAPAMRKLAEMYKESGRYARWQMVYGPRDRKTRNYLAWIYIRDEADITLLQLAGALDDC
jgi:hypothetical protein